MKPLHLLLLLPDNSLELFEVRLLDAADLGSQVRYLGFDVVLALYAALDVGLRLPQAFVPGVIGLEVSQGPLDPIVERAKEVLRLIDVASFFEELL